MSYIIQSNSDKTYLEDYRDWWDAAEQRWTTDRSKAYEFDTYREAEYFVDVQHARNDLQIINLRPACEKRPLFRARFDGNCSRSGILEVKSCWYRNMKRYWQRMLDDYDAGGDNENDARGRAWDTRSGFCDRLRVRFGFRPKVEDGWGDRDRVRGDLKLLSQLPLYRT
jgi:hypothetical protein